MDSKADNRINPLFIHLAYMKAVIDIVCSPLFDVTRAQLLILMITFEIKQYPLKSSYLTNYGISHPMARYYLLTLRRKGYINRIIKGSYNHTSKAIALRDTLEAELSRRLSLPPSWR